MKNEAFKGILWPRGKTEQGNYRYAIVGVLITDSPLDVSEKEAVIESTAGLMGHFIELSPKRPPKIPVGDAVDVLTGLDEI